MDLIPIAKVPDETPVYVCEPIEILSEYRVYVHDGDILGVKHYYGDWEVVPPKCHIEKVVKEYKPCPVSYGIDFGMIKRKGGLFPGGTMYDPEGFHNHPIVLEVNDGCNLGNYGLDSIHYGEMIVSRWFEIMAGSKVKDRICEEIIGLEDMEKEFGYEEGTFSKSRKELYFKPNDYNGKTYEQLLVSDEAVKRKHDAMKAFAEMSLEEARKTDKRPESDFIDDTIKPYPDILWKPLEETEKDKVEQFTVNQDSIKEAIKNTTIKPDDELEVLIKKVNQVIILVNVLIPTGNLKYE